MSLTLYVSLPAEKPIKHSNMALTTANMIFDISFFTLCSPFTEFDYFESKADSKSFFLCNLYDVGGICMTEIFNFKKRLLNSVIIVIINNNDKIYALVCRLDICVFGVGASDRSMRRILIL